MLALLASASALLGGALAGRGRVGPGPWIGLALLAVFVAWTGLSMTWSIAPDRTWADLNRVLAYLLAALLGVLAGAGIPRAAERFAIGFLGVVTVVAVYALAGKVTPGIVDHADEVARLRAPLEYWNALGLLCVLAAPVAIRLAADVGRRAAVRLAGLELLLLLVVVLGLTYSRGGVAVFVVAAAVVTALGGAGRLRGVVAIGATLAAAALPLAYAFMSDTLTANGAPLDQRIVAGRNLAGLLAVAAVALVGAGRFLLAREDRVTWSPARTRQIGIAVGILALLGAGWLALSQRGEIGSVTKIQEDRQYDPVRLLSTNSGTRVAWWEEAAGAWSDRPLHGWGGGSFAFLHLRYREQDLPVTQAHSMPLQLLAETGIVGFLLAYGAILALLAAALARTRRAADRGMTPALMAAAAAWLVHGLFDWGFQIPAVTAPVLFGLGLLAARREEDAVAAPAPPPLTSRAPAVALATVLAIAAVASAGLPWLSAHKADRATEIAGARTPEALEDAAAEADLAARLDPLATRPLFVASAIAARRDRLLEARAHLLEAADRAPDDPQVWVRLAILALRLADRPGYLEASERLLALDPVNPFVAAQVSKALQILTPPPSSATSTGTPLVRP